MRITLVTVGKIKEQYLVMAIDEYKKRLSRYCKLEIVEVADERTPDHASLEEERAIKDREGERIRKAVREGAYLIALAIEGKQLDSVEFSGKLGRLFVDGTSHIVFAIGGSLGLSSQVLACADDTLSFSRMTFPHQLMRVIALEQIYRGFRILYGEPYHK